jgi:hypothetical protein
MKRLADGLETGSAWKGIGGIDISSSPADLVLHGRTSAAEPTATEWGPIGTATVLPVRGTRPN